MRGTIEMILSVDHLQKYYGKRGVLTKAIDNISFEIQEAEFTAIMGPSGSGKTTLLNCISTIDRPTAGHIYIDGYDITAIKDSSLASFRREHFGYIFQDYHLIETMTGFENIALALSVQNVPSDEILFRVYEVAQHLNIEEVIDKYPCKMSGGQKQRVAAARAIVTRPSLLLADEPTGALDSRAARLLLESFSVINTTWKSTILVVTHDALTASYCKRVLFIRDGKIFNELFRGNENRRFFFEQIMEVMTLLGGDVHVF